MTRPRKTTVDWFPHATNHGQTMFILEENFGNDGYAFWFKLLELLGNSECHYIEFNNPRSQKFLVAKTRLDVETCEAILNLLSELEGIDAELWTEEQIIWSEHFVEGVAEVYRHRTTDMPKREDIPRRQSLSGIISEKTRRKSAEREREEVERVERVERGSAPPDFFSCRFFVVDQPYREKLRSEYPAVDDELLLRELSKMEDWLTDNPKPKRANGHLKNPKNFIRNWLEKIIIRTGPENSGGQARALNKDELRTAGNLAAGERLLKKWELEEDEESMNKC